MAGSVKLLTPAGGSVTINAGDTASALSITLPATTDTITTNASTQTLTNKTLTTPTISSPQITTGATINHTGSSDNGALLIGDITTPTSNTSLYLRSTSKCSINFSAGGFLAFNGAGDGSSERMRIDSSGNLGIGTTTPGYALEVHKSVMIKGNNPSTNGEYQDWPECSFNIRRSDDFVLNGITMASFGYRSDPSYFTDNRVCNIRIWDTTQAASASTSASTTKMTLGSPGSFSILTGNAAERLIIDSSGRITMPSQPAFSAFNSGASAMSGTITYTSVRVNVGSNFNSTTGRFTAPVSGVYCFHFSAFFDSTAGTNGEINIFLNGSSVARSYTSETANIYRPAHVTVMLSLSTNDYVTSYSSLPLHGNLNCYFSGHLIG